VQLGIPEHEDSRAIVRSILSLARALRIGTTAEGVERPEQLDWLRAENCDQIQGYLFSRPMPSDQVLLYITEQSPVAAWAAGLGAKP
jgi:EAL domain-containing protein (putative c-di-GMP-specific phosphodiesterase class I)